MLKEFRTSAWRESVLTAQAVCPEVESRGEGRVADLGSSMESRLPLNILKA